MIRLLNLVICITIMLILEYFNQYNFFSFLGGIIYLAIQLIIDVLREKNRF